MRWAEYESPKKKLKNFIPHFLCNTQCMVYTMYSIHVYILYKLNIVGTLIIVHVIKYISSYCE